MNLQILLWKLPLPKFNKYITKILNNCQTSLERSMPACNQLKYGSDEHRGTHSIHEKCGRFKIIYNDVNNTSHHSGRGDSLYVDLILSVF